MIPNIILIHALIACKRIFSYFAANPAAAGANPVSAHLLPSHGRPTSARIHGQLRNRYDQRGPQSFAHNGECSGLPELSAHLSRKFIFGNYMPTIVYVPRRYPKDVPPIAGTTVILTADNWDDFSYKTSFDVHLRREEGQPTQIGGLKLLFGSKQFQSRLVIEALQPIPGTDARLLVQIEAPYLSMGSGSDYYKKIRELLPDPGEREEVLQQLHDVIYLEHRQQDHPSLALRKDPGFRASLLRDSSDVKTYGSARQQLFAEDFQPDRYNFTFTYQLTGFAGPHTVKCRFDPDQARPFNTTVLIGPNGTGKSRALFRLADYLSGERTGHPDAVAQLPFTHLEPKPPFQRVIAVSFSPFDDFLLNDDPENRSLAAVKLREKGSVSTSPSYRYCGFRDLTGEIHPDIAWDRARVSLASIVEQDGDPLLSGTRPKFSSLLRALKELSPAQSQVSRNISVRARLKAETVIPPGIPQDYVRVSDGARELDVAESVDFDRQGTLDLLRSGCCKDALAFYSGDVRLYLSAGQSMFVWLAVSVVSEVARESILIVDEPELYLHPNLEVAYMKMLFVILGLFESYAIVATHSLFMAREVPARNVRIFQVDNERRPSISVPAVETFGADLMTLADYVFFNVDVVKPFQETLKSLAKSFASYEEAREALKLLLSPESLTFLRNEMAEKKFDGGGGQ